MQCRHTKHFCLCGETVSSSFSPLSLTPWRMYIAINITTQQHMILSFLLHFCPGHLQLFLQYSVSHSAFKDFCITRLWRLSVLEDQRAKNWDQRLKAVWSSWGRHSKPSPHQLGDLWNAVSSPMDHRLQGSARGTAKEIVIVHSLK